MPRNKKDFNRTKQLIEVQHLLLWPYMPNDIANLPVIPNKMIIIGKTMTQSHNISPFQAKQNQVYSKLVGKKTHHVARSNRASRQYQPVLIQLPGCESCDGTTSTVLLYILRII